MRDFHLRFFIERRTPDGIEALNDADDKEIQWMPETAGVYALGANDGTLFSYPWGTSPIYYIGQSKELRKQMIEHRKFILQAITGSRERKCWPRYQYGASFGATVAWYSVRGAQFPNKLQTDLLAAFYDLYGSLPLANSTWPSSLRPVLGSRDE